MGSYANLRIGAVSLWSSKGSVDPVIMTLFRENDKKVFRGTVKKLKLQHVDFDFDYYGDKDNLTILQYSTTASNIKDRLELMGFTSERAKESFYKGLKDRIIEYEESYFGSHKRELLLLHNLDHNIWLENIKLILRKKLTPINHGEKPTRRYTPILRYILTNSDNNFGFPGNDFRHYLRMLLENFSDSEPLVYDLTDILSAGYIHKSDNLVEFADTLISEDFPFSKKIILLTEGKSDKWILQRSLKLLYPHLFEYFHFMDFDGFNVEGGASILANITKAFAGAGIVNRVISLFDNDTAAASAIQTLSKTELPHNIVLRTYPNLELASDYPTIGPTGIFTMNVNGLAGSIELYLGCDVLRDINGNFTPIQWKGYDSKLNKYQGEITNKINIQTKFKEKLTSCELHPELLSQYDWSGLRAIFDNIRTAFHGLNSLT